MTSAEQARLVREEAARENLANRKRLFDHYLAARTTTPTFEADRQRFQDMDLRRSLNDPPAAEITSGRALNVLLDALKKAQDQESQQGRPDVPLDEAVLRHLNVTSAPVSAALLKNQGRLDWPLELRGDSFRPEREALDMLAADAVRQAANGRVEASVLRDMAANSRQLRGKLTAAIGDLAPSRYMDAVRFLDRFDEAVRALGRPDGGGLSSIRGAVPASGVAGLVRFMASRGLHFAPALPGDEPAYRATHRALAAAMSGRAELSAER
jgi:hypothetical protein